MTPTLAGAHDLTVNLRLKPPEEWERRQEGVTASRNEVAGRPSRRGTSSLTRLELAVADGGVGADPGLDHPVRGAVVRAAGARLLQRLVVEAVRASGHVGQDRRDLVERERLRPGQVVRRAGVVGGRAQHGGGHLGDVAS